MIYHAWTKYTPKDADTIRRNELAQRTWTKQAWHEIPVRDEDLPRLFKEGTHAWPYIKDVFDFSCQHLRDSDILVYTNADIHVRRDTSMAVTMAMQGTDALYVFRRDFPRLNEPLFDWEYEKGQDYCGSDLKAFRVSWWRTNRTQMGDMVLGGEAWDPMIRWLIDTTNKGCVTALQNIIAHERHASFWEQPHNRYTLAMQKHCLRTAYAWFKARGVRPEKFGIKKI